MSLNYSDHKLYSKNFDLYSICVWNIPSKMGFKTLSSIFSGFGSIVQIKRIGVKPVNERLKTAVRIQFTESQSALEAIRCKKLNNLFISESYTQPLQIVPNFDENFPLEDLNDDCLLHLYSYLQFEDHINLTKISKRLKCLVQYYYKVNKTFNEKNANLNHTTLYAINNFFMENGESIENLILFKSAPHRFRLQIIRFALKYSPNMKTLKVNGYLPKSDFELIIKTFVGLKTLHLGSTIGSKIGLNDCLKSNNIETLIINGDQIFDEGGLQRACPHLKHLSIWNSIGVNGLIINQFPKYLQNLETLRINLNGSDLIKQLGAVVKDMPMLKKLRVSLTDFTPLGDSLNSLCVNHLEEILDILRIDYFLSAELLKFVNLNKLIIRCFNNFILDNEEFWDSIDRLSKYNLEYLHIYFNFGPTSPFDLIHLRNQYHKDVCLKISQIVKNNKLQKLFTLIFSFDDSNNEVHKTIFNMNGIVRIVSTTDIFMDEEKQHL